MNQNKTELSKTTTATVPQQQVPAQALYTLLAEARKNIKLQQTLGITEYQLSSELTTFLQGQNKQPQASPRTSPPLPKKQQKVMPAAVAVTALVDLEEEMQSCQRCSLHNERKQLVFGQGKTGANLMIIGDNPSQQDNKQGLPFGGAAGELLDKMLAAIGLSRNDVYLTNLTKCYGQPLPTPEAIAGCFPFLLRQIEAVAPKIICTMGPLASQKMLNAKEPLTRLRGKFHKVKEIPLMATFHPDFLIKNQEMKKAVWQDLQLIQKKLKDPR